MKKLLISLVILSFTTLTSCGAGFGSFNNPLTKTALVNSESAYGVVLASAVAYRDLCNKRVLNRVTCTQVVAKLQAADRAVQVALKNLRTFTAKYPTIDASSLVQVVKDAVDDFKAISNAAGVP